jgi:hypothetical protein
VADIYEFTPDFKQRIVCVVWVDSHTVGHSSWVDKDDESLVDPGSLECKSVGYLWGEDEDSITLVAHQAHNELAGDITIPKVAIKSMVDLKEN